MMPTLLPFPNRPFAPAPTAIPQLFDEGECHNTLGVNQTQRQAEQTIQCVCGCLCKNQSLRVSLAFGCQQLSGDAESVRASARGGGRPAPFGPAIPTRSFSQLSPTQAAAKKLAFANQPLPCAACTPPPAAAKERAWLPLSALPHDSPLSLPKGPCAPLGSWPGPPAAWAASCVGEGRPRTLEPA